MAKRSEFAQKLLDDLRLRKERLAASSHSSNRSNSMAGAGEKYSFSRQTSKGSREMSTQRNIGSKTGAVNKRSNAGNRSLAIEDASKQIVPFGQGRSPEQIGDLSMALAFALENGGKLRKIDYSGSNPVLGFLQQIGRGSVDFRKMERNSILDRQRSSTSRFPTLSHLHIKEISKGAQKLNQILKTCSNGLNFDGYSIEIGKELLKGAMDLEESLRMLVNLQEASEYMVTPQKKNQNRIRLLEGDEDDDDDIVEIAEQKQLDRPRFSFDKPLRNSHGTQEVSRTGLKQRLMALTYSTEAHNVNNEQQALITSNSVSHKRSSSSYGANGKTVAAFSEQKKRSGSSQSKPEKRGLPNVIAKLMGLEELPENVNSKHATLKESSSKQKIEGTVLQKTAQGSTKNAELKTRETANPALHTKQKVIQANKISVTQETTIVLQVEKNLLTRNSSFEMLVHDAKIPWKDSESEGGIKPVTVSKNGTIKINKQQSNIAQSNQINGSRKDIQEKEKRQDYTKHREQKGLEKEPVINDEMQQVAPQTHKIRETRNVLQEKTGNEASTLQTEKRSTSRLLLDNQQKPLPGHGLQQQEHMLQKYEPQEEKRQADEREQQMEKQRLQGRKQRVSEAVSKNSSKPMHDGMNMQKKNPYMDQAIPSKKSSTEAIDAMTSKGFPIIRHHEDFVKDRSSTSLKVNMKDSMNRSSDPNASPKDLKTESEKAKVRIRPVMEEKHVQVLSSQKKIHNTKVHTSETPRKIDEVMTRKIGTSQNLARPLKHKVSMLQEMKPRRHDKISGSKGAAQVSVSRSKEAKIRIIRSNKSEASIHPLYVAQQLQKEAEQATTHSPVGGECECLKEPDTLDPNDSCQNITSKVSNDQQGQALVLGKDQELKSHKTVSSPLNGTYEGNMEITYHSQLENQKNSKWETQEPLTENEIHLKQIFTKNQLLLNTAEALFKLNIPFGILHASGHNCQDEDSKLILDCGYEIMRRKGRKQELTVHPYMKICISSMKVRSLDDLVKQLHKDLEKLKYYGGNEGDECDAADYLPKMLERDIQNRDPDVNCMWDYGWNEMMFACPEKDDVIKDVERHVLNGLLDEITRDFLRLSVSV